jgi:hypothetical protein
MKPCEYLVRVRLDPNGREYTATIRQFAGSQHPEVRAVIGPVSLGHGATVPAAIVSAVAEAHLAEMSATQIVEVPRNGH